MSIGLNQYKTILTPDNEECNSLGNLIEKEWYQYSTDINFLHDTQNIFKEWKKMKKKKDSNHFSTIWDDVRTLMLWQTWWCCDTS